MIAYYIHFIGISSLVPFNNSLTNELTVICSVAKSCLKIVTVGDWAILLPCLLLQSTISSDLLALFIYFIIISIFYNNGRYTTGTDAWLYRFKVKYFVFKLEHLEETLVDNEVNGAY